ncbi:MAG TPA: hypothetical protein VGN34_15135 [Ktedonobacteraceae bacterium]
MRQGWVAEGRGGAEREREAVCWGGVDDVLFVVETQILTELCQLCQTFSSPCITQLFIGLKIAVTYSPVCANFYTWYDALIEQFY